MALAEQAGQHIARYGHVLITGGRTGVMEAAAKGARQEDGVAVGILPSPDRSASNAYNNVVIPTGMGYTRNALNILAADVVISIGGMVGTLNEIGYAWMWQRPIFGIVGSGGWTDKLIGTTLDERWERAIPGINLEQLAAYCSAWANGEVPV